MPASGNGTRDAFTPLAYRFRHCPCNTAAGRPGTLATTQESIVVEQQYRLGIDGGGTGCRARLVDAQGQVIGHGEAGPANLTLGAQTAKDAVLRATHAALAQAGLDERALPRTRAGLGLAGANAAPHRRAFEQVTLPFASWVLRSDAETACLGAHGGHDGAILILGTGSQGVVYRDGRFDTVGGWGFALSDSGSGAILGRAAVRRAFLAREGIEPGSPFTDTVMGRFGNDYNAMLEWASRARPREWAEFARTVFDHARQGDPVALQLARSSAASVERMLDRLIALGAARISLMGGVAQPTKSYLEARYAEVLVEPLGDALDGALLLCHLETTTAAGRL